jgi:hypothetical protein
LEEKKRQLCYLILENKQTAHMCVAKLPAETHTGACNIQVPLSKQEDKVKVSIYYPYDNFAVHSSYCKKIHYQFVFWFIYNYEKAPNMSTPHIPSGIYIFINYG